MKNKTNKQNNYKYAYFIHLGKLFIFNKKNVYFCGQNGYFFKIQLFFVSLFKN